MEKVTSVALVTALSVVLSLSFFSLNQVEASYKGSKHNHLKSGKSSKRHSKKLRYRRGGEGGCQTLSSTSLQQKANPYGKTIASAANQYGVSQNLIKAVITIESCFKSSARGSQGEKGLMQLMPDTARRLNVRDGYNSWQNIHGGTRYLSTLLKHYNGNPQRAIAAYNAGEGNVSKSGHIPNKSYVTKVMHAYNKFSRSKELFSTARQTDREAIQKTQPRRIKAHLATVIDRMAESRPGKPARAAFRAVATTATRPVQPSPPRASAKDRTLPWADLPARSNLTSTYTVKQGETVFAVMRHTGVPVKSLVSLNHLPAPYGIKTGQVLRLR